MLRITSRIEEAAHDGPAISVPRYVAAVGPFVLIVAIFWQEVKDVAALALGDDRCTYIIVIPFLSGLLIWLQRERIFAETAHCLAAGLPLVLVGCSLKYILGQLLSWLPAWDRLSVAMALFVLTLISGFILCFGTRAFRRAAFPFLFLLMMIPIPSKMLDASVLGLQEGSTVASDWLFRLAGVPVVRHGFQLSLPGVDIEVAEQCSSIRSSLSLFITGLLASYIFLQSAAKRVVLILLTIPISILKNAIRIFSISWLGMHISPNFFHGALHRHGGLPFSLIALGLLVGSLFLLSGSLSGVDRLFGTGKPRHS